MEYKVELSSLDNFKAWAGALDTLNTVRERGGMDILTTICEDIFSGDIPTEVQINDLTTICEEIFCGDIPTEVQINDWLWFDSDFIYQALGYEDLLEN